MGEVASIPRLLLQLLLLRAHLLLSLSPLLRTLYCMLVLPGHVEVVVLGAQQVWLGALELLWRDCGGNDDAA